MVISSDVIGIKFGTKANVHPGLGHFPITFEEPILTILYDCLVGELLGSSNDNVVPPPIQSCVPESEKLLEQ
jgi:hypothetical protein